MATALASNLSFLQLSRNDGIKFISSENGYVNAIKFEAKAGSRAYRNHIRIFTVLHDERERCLTERKSRNDDKKDLPISASELRVNQLILADVYEGSNGFGVEGICYVYDNRAMMYTSEPICGCIFEFEIQDKLHSHRYLSGKKLRVEIRNDGMGSLDLNDPKFFAVTASTGQEDHELRSFYELLVVQGALNSRDCFAVGSEMYICEARTRPFLYRLGICFLSGFKKNARIVQENGKAVMKVVVDPVDSAFYFHQRVADSFHDVTNGDYGNQHKVKQFLDLYKKVRVNLSFNKSKIITVLALSKEKLEDISFEKDGVQIRVIDYFRDFYQFQSAAGKMPALEVRMKNGEHAYYPLDCLDILKCQKVPMYKFPLVSSSMHDDILKRNAVKAPQRFDKTSTCFSYVERSQDIFKSFGTHFSPCQMIHLIVRGKPSIVSGTGTVNPDFRTRFDIRRHRYIGPSSCTKWMILNGSQQDIRVAVDKLLAEARNRGLELGAPEIQRFNSGDTDKENWTQLFDDLAEYGYEYVLLVDPKKSRQAQTHNMLKCCELIYGIQTQQVHVETLMRYPCHENIAHKMNMKLNGINYNVKLEPCSISQLFYDDKVFVIGYDVAHPPQSGSLGEAEPSIVGVSFNAGRHYQSFNGDYFFQPSNQESVDSRLLKKAVLHGLEMRRSQRPETCSSAPELVFVFRDGLSEGQILMAKAQELEAIKEAFIEFYGTEQQLPPFVMVLATKRHNRRFYNPRHENVATGTVASQGIARLGAEEFYMLSAFPIQGTAKLTDYEVIANDAGISLNDVQAFTHGMCYLHQIVASAVSLPVPIYVAHELAKRGRNNLLCYKDIAAVPRNAEGGINYHKLNQKFTYMKNDLVHRRFNA